jgi:hypothetical protein
VASRYSIFREAGGKHKGVNMTWAGYVDDSMLKMQLYQVENTTRFGSILVEQLDCPAPKPTAKPSPCTGSASAGKNIHDKQTTSTAYSL